MIEYRFVERKLAAAAEGKLSGRAASYNSTTDIGDTKSWGFRETIAPGAFKKALKKRDIVLLDQHDSSKPLARVSAGTLELKEHKEGLDFDAKPSDTSYGRDALINARDGNYGGCSFGFTIPDGGDSWKRGKDGVDERTITEVELHEISTVTFPAYGDTNVSARDSLSAARESRERALGPIREDGHRIGWAERAGDAPGNGKKPYGDVKYADAKNGKYPVDTLKHVKAAWAYINKPANAAKYPLNGVSLASVKAKIKAAMKKFGVGASEDDATLDYDVAELREMVSELLTYEFRETSIGVQERETLEAVLEYLSRGDDDAADEYDDDFYEDGDAEEDGDRAGQNGPAKGPAKDSSEDDGKSDAKNGTSGKQAGDECPSCDKGKDKSGNKCAACGGSGHTNGDGSNNESGKGDEDDDKSKGSGKKFVPGKEKNSDTSASETRDDESRSDVDRANRMFAHRAKMRREREAASAAPVK